MNKRIFTPAAIEIIRELAAQEKMAWEIAHVIGSTAASVRVKCSQLKIPLSRRGRPTLVPTLPDPLERKKLVISMRPAGYASLQHQATRMQRPIGELAGVLLEAIVGSDIYDAILDDDR